MSVDATIGTRYPIPPASATTWASSGVCLAMSDSVDAATLFNVNSGSYKHRTVSGTAPASTTNCAKSALCLAIYPNANSADSLHPGSNSCKQETIASNAPLSNTACASCALCLTTERIINAALFLKNLF